MDPRSLSMLYFDRDLFDPIDNRQMRVPAIAYFSRKQEQGKELWRVLFYSAQNQFVQILASACVQPNCSISGTTTQDRDLSCWTTTPKGTIISIQHNKLIHLARILSLCAQTCNEYELQNLQAGIVISSPSLISASISVQHCREFHTQFSSRN